MVRTGHKRSVPAMVVALATCAAAVLVPAPANARGGWRPFAPTSPWNVPAAQKGGITTSNPFASQFTSYSSSLEISGVAPDSKWGKPIFFAGPGDPEYRWTDQNGWAKGDIRYQGEPIPMPAGAHQATGSDGHLTIVTADRRYEYDMWRADVSGHTAETIVRFDLAGGGVPADRNDNTSARGSGTPLISTTIRAEEALTGIDHAVGLTVPSVAGDYVFPATHSDGDLGSNSVKYGMLFVLRPDFPVSAGAGRGERNIIVALKTYGAYVVDQGASMGIDADSTHPELWSQAGMLGDAGMPIHASDWRLVNVGTASAAGPTPPSRHRRRVVLHVARHAVRIGGHVVLRGKVRGTLPAGADVRLMVRSGRHWLRLRRKPIEAGGTFASSPRLVRKAAAARRYGPERLALKNVRLPHGVMVLRIRAVVRGVGRSNVVRVRVRR
jgi:hypothetical protein